jgi:hypothetical protein
LTNTGGEEGATDLSLGELNVFWEFSGEEGNPIGSRFSIPTMSIVEGFVGFHHKISLIL